jgi:Tol biopolymer transport system component
LLLTVSDQTKGRTYLIAVPVAGGDRKILIDEPSVAVGGEAHYLDTGHLVYYMGRKLFAVPFNPGRLEVLGTPLPVVQGVREAFSGAGLLSVSDSGALIYVPGPTAASVLMDIALSDRNGSEDRLKLQPRSYQTPRVSPDGKRIAFGIEDGAEANIWIYDLSGAKAMQRLTFGGKNKFPVWSRDGQRIAFQSDREGDSAIFWQQADGSGVAERLTKPEQGVSHAPESWSPIADILLFRARQDSKVSLFSLSLRDKKEQPFGGVHSIDPTGAVFSPDGRWVAYHTRESGQDPEFAEINVQPFPATGARYQLPVSRDNHHPAWSRDGKELFYIPGPGEMAAITFTSTPSVAFGNPVQVRPAVNTYSPDVPRQYDITPDGKFIGLLGSDQSVGGAPITPQINIILNWLEELKQRVPIK